MVTLALSEVPSTFVFASTFVTGAAHENDAEIGVKIQIKRGAHVTERENLNNQIHMYDIKSYRNLPVTEEPLR